MNSLVVVIFTSRIMLLSEIGMVTGGKECAKSHANIMLIHWGQERMVVILQTIVLKAFSCMKVVIFLFQFEWNLCPGKNQHISKALYCIIWYWLSISLQVKRHTWTGQLVPKGIAEKIGLLYVTLSRTTNSMCPELLFVVYLYAITFQFWGR